jgi:hypothetical protein
MSVVLTKAVAHSRISVLDIYCCLYYERMSLLFQSPSCGLEHILYRQVGGLCGAS